jgi:predicted NAD/FAD-binding protein
MAEVLPKKDLSKIPITKTSSHLDDKTSIVRHLPYQDGNKASYVALNAEDWVDPLDHRFNAIMQNVVSFQTITYDGESFPSLSLKFYGNTSSWWMIAWFNGVIHPDEVQRGDPIKIPDLGFLTARASSRAVRAGEKFTF